MTGPQHYHAAEDCQKHASKCESGSALERSWQMDGLVHAVLALAAATGLNDAETGKAGLDCAEWQETAAVRSDFGPPGETT